MIDVIRAGLLTTVQDLGRHGYRHLGVAMGGALDRLSLEVGNRLVGNRPDAACLEITFGPTVLRFPRATRIAITGTEFGATLDGKPVYSWWSLPVQAGQELTLQAARRGMRGYVCIAGGIDVLPMLGSRSTDLAGQFGGLGGRALRDGDRLPVGAPAPGAGVGFSPQAPEFGVKAPAWCKFVLVHEPLRRGRHPSGVPWAAPIRVLPGSEYEHFPASAQEAFWSDEWLVTPNSNRMGYRLAGTALERTHKTDLLSHAVMPGTIQV
ncbi:MAG: biotin-dependent carboxyltransferase family protein, partial [Paraburkholderia sp.]